MDLVTEGEPPGLVHGGPGDMNGPVADDTGESPSRARKSGGQLKKWGRPPRDGPYRQEQVSY